MGESMIDARAGRGSDGKIRWSGNGSVAAGEMGSGVDAGWGGEGGAMGSGATKAGAGRASVISRLTLTGATSRARTVGSMPE